MLAHCEDINLVNGGVMNEDVNARELGLGGITNSVEDIIIARDIMLSRDTGARLPLVPLLHEGFCQHGQAC